MELLITLGTDDGENLTDGHACDAKFFYLYKLSDDREEYVEQRRDIQLGLGQYPKSGIREMAMAGAAVFKSLNASVGKEFGPDLPNLLSKQFVCVLLRIGSLSKALEVVCDNLNRIGKERDKGEDRKHIVLKP